MIGKLVWLRPMVKKSQVAILYKEKHYPNSGEFIFFPEVSSIIVVGALEIERKYFYEIVVTFFNGDLKKGIVPWMEVFR